jgi:hypothetical protein
MVIDVKNSFSLLISHNTKTFQMMLTILFLVVLFIHGLIHVLGFAKAFHLGNIPKLTYSISKPLGLLWALVAILFLIAGFFYITNRGSWSGMCLMGIVPSQVLIFFAWKDAKYGTVANLLLLAIAWPAYGSRQFEKMVKAEQMDILSKTEVSLLPVTEADIQHLPRIVQQWMRHSGVVGKPPAAWVQLKQTGKMKLNPESGWMNFSANQIFEIQKPAFVWNTRATIMPGVFFTGRDKFENGEGSMVIKLLSLVRIVNEQNNIQINSGTALRYLGEISWFPSAVLNEYVSWEAVDPLRARATLSVGEQRVEGLFTFRSNGELVAFEADRFYGSGTDAKKERWLITHTGYKEFDGIRIPYRSSVTWKLKEGDFTWLQLEITELEAG